MASSAEYNEDDYEYSFRNAPPNLQPAFKNYASETLNNCISKLKLSIDNIDIDNALFHIGLLTRYLELKYPITRKIRKELCNLCLILLFEFPTDLMQQITIMKVTSKLIKNENLGTVGLELDWKPFYNLLLSIHYSCNNGSTQMDSKGILNTHSLKLKDLISKCSCYFKQESFSEILNEILPYFNPYDIYYNRSIDLLLHFLPYKQLWVSNELKKYKIQLKINNISQDIKYDNNTPDLLIFLLDQILNETIWVSTSSEKLIQILINIITYNREFIIYFKPFIYSLFHYLYLNSELPINGRSCILKKSDRLRKGSLNGKDVLSFSFHHIGIQNIIELLIYLMDNGGNNDEIQLLFIQFFNNCTNYFYPDENRKTTSISIKLTSILASFASIYTNRYWRELRGYNNINTPNIYDNIPIHLKQNIYTWHAYFNKKHPFYKQMDNKYKLCISDKLFKSLIPIIKWSIYAKSPYIQYGGYSSIKYLSTLFPNITIQWAMNEIRECLQSITQSHRLSIGIGLLDSITPLLLNRYLLPDIQFEFINLLKLILFGIDPSLNKQCTITMSYLDNIFTKIPIISAKNYKNIDDIKQDNDNDDINIYNYNDNIGIKSTYNFEEFALLFCNKILKYARDSSTSLDSLKSSGQSNDTSGIKNFMPRGNRLLLKKFKKCVYSFWFAISKDIYIKCRDKIYETIIDEPQCGSLGGIIISGMIYPYPQLSLDLFLPKIINKILFIKGKGNNNKFSNKYEPDVYELRGSKEVLNYYLGLIEAIVIPSHSNIIKYIPILSNIITICINSHLPEIKKYAGPILQAVIVTLIRETPLEARSFSPDIWNEENGKWKHWRYWGQFPEIEMKGLYKTWRPNLKLKWFYPTQTEINAIQELINYTLSEPLKEINEFINTEINENESPKLKAEQLLEYIRVLYHFCYGVGHLGDFDIDKHNQLLPTVKEDNYFTITQNSSNDYFTYIPSKDINDNIYGTLNKLRSMLKLPNCNGNNISLRTVFTRLSIKLYQKLSQYSDTSDYIIDKNELPDNDNENDTEMSDNSFSNVNISDIIDNKQENNSNDDEEKEKSLSALKKSKLFPGVSKVLVWLNTFVNVMINHDGVMWGVVSNHYSGMSRVLRKIRGDHIFTGHIYNNRPALVNEAHALTLKRLYFLYNHNSYTTDVRNLIEELVKCSISEFQNVRKQAIHAIISGRSIYNFRSAVEWAFNFWLKIIKDNKSEKSQLLGATHALNNRELMSQLILRTSQRDRDFIYALLNSSMHREPTVQSNIYQIFFTYFNTKTYKTIYLPPNISKNEQRQKEIEMINNNLKKEHELLQEQLLFIAKNDQLGINNKLKLNDVDSISTISSNISNTESISSDSYVKIPSTPNDPVVSSLSSLINNLDLDSLKIDFTNLPFDINNVTPQALSEFLNKQGFNLPPTMFSSLTQQQLQSIIDSSQLKRFIKKKSPQKRPKNKEKETVNVHWKYQLMATILLWKSLRPNITPNKEFIEYIVKLIGNEIPSLNRVAITSLTCIISNYLPLLHYKNVIGDVNKYPIEHTFGWFKCYADKININNLHNDIPLYMRPRAQLNSECASIIHKYLSNNLDILCKAFALDHPNITDPSAPQQNRRSSDTQLRNLIKLEHLWPYDGYDVTLDWWEYTHYILIRDILRCKWPNTDQDIDMNHWKYDENLWNMAIDQFNIHGKNIKEKEKQLAAGEILAGILRAYHQFIAIDKLPIKVELLTNKIIQPLLKIMQQCPQESEENWCSAIRAGLANSDPKYVEWFTHPILTAVVENLQIKHVENTEQKQAMNDDISKKQYISPDKQVRAMRYGSEILISYGYRGEKEWRYILSSFTNKSNKINFNNEYKENINDNIDQNVFDCYFANTYRTVRGDIGVLLGQIVRCLRTQPLPLLTTYDVTNTDTQFTSLLNIIQTKYLSLWNLQNKEQINKQENSDKNESDEKKDEDKYTKKYNNFLETMCFWVLQCYNHNSVIFYQSLFVRLLPLILYGQYREDKKTMEVVKMTTEVIAWTSFHESQILTIFDSILNTNRTPKLINNSSWKIRKEILRFLLQFICRNAIILNKNEKYQQLIIDYLINNSLRDKQLEVRITAKNVLTALIQSTNLKNIQHIKILQNKFEKLTRTKLPKRNYDSVDTGFNKKMNIKLRKKHCGILGLSSLILSVPYTCPNWLPEILSFVSVFDRERAPIGITAKKTVSEFKRTHQDEWHIFKRQFTLEQLSNIQDASSSSYFV